MLSYTIGSMHIDGVLWDIRADIWPDRCTWHVRGKDTHLRRHPRWAYEIVGEPFSGPDEGVPHTFAHPGCSECCA